MPTDAEILDQRALIVWADDPEVEFVDFVIDYNAPHGTNLESDKEGVS